MATTDTQRDTAGNIAAPCVACIHRNMQRGDLAASPQAIPLWATPFKLKGLDSYPGGKGADGTVQRLINEIPPHRNYIEPFLGGGAIVRHKIPAPGLNIAMEVDAPLFRTWRDQAPAWLTVYNDDGLKYMAEGPFLWSGSPTFYFIDPPYLDETLKTGRAPYRHRMTYDQHLDLLTVLREKYHAPHNLVMICALPNLLYERELAGWRTFHYQNKTRRGMQTEQVWMNYPKPTALHDYRYLGEGYRDRERIRRKQRNKLKELELMDPLERNAMLEAIRQVYP